MDGEPACLLTEDTIILTVITIHRITRLTIHLTTIHTVTHTMEVDMNLHAQIMESVLLVTQPL